MIEHPITQKSFAIIDQEIGSHNFSHAEYPIVRRVIHSTADFEFAELIKFSPRAIEKGIAYLRQGNPIITDVGMVKQGIVSMAAKTFGNQVLSAVAQIKHPLPGKTRTETGILSLFSQYPQSIYVIGNAPTALLSLCEQITTSPLKPALVIGAPVGFVSVLESKQALIETNIPQIVVHGRKGGSPVAAAILNALLVLST